MEIPGAVRASLCADDEYVFGASVTEAFDQERDGSALAWNLIAQTQQTAQGWLNSESPAIQERHRDVQHSFQWTATEVPARIGPDLDVKRDVVSWLATAQPTEVRAFMEWNVAEQRIMQADLETRLPALQERTIRAIARLVCEDSLPLGALRAYSPSKTKPA